MMGSIWHVNILDGYKKYKKKPENIAVRYVFLRFSKKRYRFLQ